MQFKSLSIAIALSLVSIVKGIAVAPRGTLDVFVPTIITPDAQTIWTIGRVETVTWDTSNAPVNISNGAAVVLNATPHLTLVSGFDLRSGSVQVTVPPVLPGEYTITLFGDSGNFSPAFTIAA